MTQFFFSSRFAFRASAMDAFALAIDAFSKCSGSSSGSSSSGQSLLRDSSAITGVPLTVGHRRLDVSTDGPFLELAIREMLLS
jgi:hypothetical protein